MHGASEGVGQGRPNGHPPPSCARANAPLFVKADGQAYATSDVAKLGKQMATMAGVNASEAGGKLWRIGGATDLRDVLGLGGAKVIKERGRWHSDISFVYQRALLGQQLDAAAAAADAADEDIEAMVEGWVQPSTFR